MKILKLKIENLFSYKDTEINFDGLDFALFKGKNGVGKSSVFDILCWSIFGQTARKKYRNILRDLPDKPKVGSATLWFEENGNIYKIVRGTNRTLLIFQNDDEKPIEYRTQTMVQEQIEKIIGLDHKTFLNIAYFSQGDVGKFLSCESNERIKIITDILQLDSVDDLRKNIEKDMQGISYDVENFRGRLALCNDIISSTDIKELKHETSRLKKEFDDVNKELVEYDHQISSINNKMILLDQRKIHMLNYTRQKEYFSDMISKKKVEIKKAEQLKDKTDEINEAIKEIRAKYSNEEILKAELKEVDADIAKFEKYEHIKSAEYKSRKSLVEELGEAVKLKGKECPTCHSILTEKSAQFIEERIKEINVELAGISKKIKSVLKKIEIANNRKYRINNDLKEYNVLHQRELKYKNELSDIKHRKDMIERMKTELAELQNNSDEQLKKHTESISKIDAKLEKFKKFDQELLSKFTLKFQELEKERSDIERYITEIKHKEEKYWDAYRQVKELKSRLEAFEKDHKIMSFWKDALPKIKVMIISNVIPFVESETNKYLSQILPGKNIKFIVDPNKANNKIDILINDYDNKIKRIFEGWSGGERDKMSLSVYLALNKLASLRSGKQINFLILDEKFASIDSESRMVLFDMLRKEYNGRKIWAISHIKDIDSEFDEIVTIEKTNSISNINIRVK